MKTPKSRTKRADDRRTVEEARRAFSDSAEATTSAYVFRLRHAWEAVAINLEAVEALHRAGKSWDEIGTMLGSACGFEAIAGQSVRVYRSRLKSGKYDAELSRLGLRREGKALLPLADGEPTKGTKLNADDAVQQHPASTEDKRAKPTEADQRERSEGRDEGSASSSQGGVGKEPGAFNSKPDPLPKRSLP